MNNLGFVILPDVLSNAGGVIVSYLEWLQGRETQFYSEEEVFKQLFEKMQATFDRIYPQYFNDKYSLREQSYIQAVKKLCSTLYRQGKLY